MTSKMQQFIKLDRRPPLKRDAKERLGDFGEITGILTRKTASAQASRCSQCGIPFCQINCPLSNNTPDWLMMAAAGRMEEAWRISQHTNPFPEICGRICPQDRLCEGHCTLEQSGYGGVTIGAIEKHIAEFAWEKGWVHPPAPVSKRKQSVAVIGAGPAGLAAADRLRRMGFRVAIYDRHDRAGGLLIYGIPGFKLDKSVVTRRTELMAKGGIEFHLNVEIGRDVSLKELQNQHDAVLIATGVYQSRPLNVPGDDLHGVHDALDYLIASNRANLGDEPTKKDKLLIAKGKDVVVIGGGDTAMDCVRTALRQGARSVCCLYRRDRSNMPGSTKEVANAEEEGAQFIWQAAPIRVLGDKKVSGLQIASMHLGAIDRSGRRSPEPLPGSERKIEADMIIHALGFEPENARKIFGDALLETHENGVLAIDPTTRQTSLDGVFAAGDIARGASLVVWAIRDGKDAADSIEAWLSAKEQKDQSALKNKEQNHG